MLGERDDATGFVAHHPLVAEAARRFSGWRVPRTGLVLEALIPSIIEQKVAGQEAFGSYRTLIHRYGERAPGEGGERGLWVAPSATTWARIPSWEWLKAGGGLGAVRGSRFGQPVPRAASSSASTWPPMTRLGDCAPCRGSGSGPRPRCGTRHWVMPTP